MVKLFFPSNNKLVFQNIKLTLVPFVICLALFSFAEVSFTEQIKINLIGGAPLDLRPFSGNSSWKTVMNLVCDRLYNRDITSGQLEPSLADSYEVAADNSSFTVHLKPGLKFHNKESVTAEDVKFSFEVFREPKIRSLSKDHLAKSISKIEILDPLTFKMYPTDAHFFNLDVALNDYFVIPKKHYSRPKNLTSKSRLPICSGPYQVTSWTPGQAVELTRFSEWES
ncbi:MAG TPA: ABC transporter substrate-binding protein, partial [Pseudobdellovibrionaceae bacterium]|nr:ABC transporter substrate-binding protein [Pseudobdellovibrionaceae bacterium]